MQSKPLVSVLVLNYNGMAHLPVCLASLAKQTYSNYELFLIDNNSSDDSINYVKNNFPKIKIIQSNENRGTAGGFNFGAKSASGDYLLFLANDLEVESNLIEELVNKMQEDKNIAICSGKMMKFDRRDVIDYNGFQIDLFAFPYAPGHNEKDAGQGEELVDVVPTGTVLLIKKEVFREAGGFDDSYFTLGDEIDLWWRIKLLGYRLVINHNAIVYHKAAATLSKEKRPRLRFYSEKNTIRTMLKNYSFLTLVIILPIYFLLVIAEALFWVLILRPAMFKAVLRALWWNIVRFKDTYRQRRIIQSKRKITDTVILKEMLLKSLKAEMFLQFLFGKIRI